MTCEVITISGATCVRCPSRPFRASRPAGFVESSVLGWNAGARSIDRIDGDCYLEWDMPLVSGVVCGITTQFLSTTPDEVQHGFFFQNIGGGSYAGVVELGVEKTVPTLHASDAVFRIERVGGRVRYMIDGDVIYYSDTRSTLSLITVGLLYDRLDGIGRDE